MKNNLLFILLMGTTLFCCCSDKQDISGKFNNLKDKDYSEFFDISITYRKGTYLFTLKDQEYLINTNPLTNKIKSIRNRNDSTAQTSDLDIVTIKDLIRKFNKLDVAVLSVDKNKNVLLLFYSHNCAYYFLKLNKESSLKDLKKDYFVHYENNWYLNKECAEK